ncbi:hypothetical protein RN001_008213 [Aquatica leii]|uniref:Uncharacterized protein n=1 Tax=Aquatica leii TaxID=1421715 RepID=A0AAN7SGH3_9COLE|nr:hypothetical protein RN001_008213 [Aquatica leii]
MEIERSKLIETSKNLENALEKVKLDLQKAQVEFQRICVREEQVRQQLEKREEAFHKKEEENFHTIQVLKRDYESKLLEMKENHEKELKSTVEHLQAITKKDAEKTHGLEDKINDLHKELNNANLQYSEIMLEKSKMKNENNVLQNTVQKLREQEALLSEELNAVVSKYSKKLSQLENHNFTISLQLNEFRKTQADCKSFSTSLPNHLSVFHNGSFVYKRQNSDHSGYVSEDVPIERNRIMDIIGQNINVLDAIEDQDRLNATSSPDLGIESDQGRFSSLEANINVQRPFLPSLEIAQNMNELLDPFEDISCANEECCKKAKQISNENVDLRKRLLRTRRALEDTLTRLTLANKQKKEVEKSICKQIHKTSQALFALNLFNLLVCRKLLMFHVGGPQNYEDSHILGLYVSKGLTIVSTHSPQVFV